VVINKQAYDAASLLQWFKTQRNFPPKVPHTQRMMTGAQFLNVLRKGKGEANMSRVIGESLIGGYLHAGVTVGLVLQLFAYNEMKKILVDNRTGAVLDPRRNMYQIERNLQSVLQTFNNFFMDVYGQKANTFVRFLDISLKRVIRPSNEYIIEISYFPVYFDAVGGGASVHTIALHAKSDGSVVVPYFYIEDRKFKAIRDVPVEKFDFILMYYPVFHREQYRQTSGPRPLPFSTSQFLEERL
jgi:hypothetical protein